MNLASPLGLYVHWPYCARICPYCDFNVVRDRGGDTGRLSDAIVADIFAQAALTGPRDLVSIFFGGGTPSLMQPQVVAQIIAAARTAWTPAADLEITLEANPTDAEADKFAAFADAGVNRLSLGVQSLSDAALKLLGRSRAVNISAGMPIVRTSVAHGTAYDIAGKGIADAGSLVEAARIAALLARSSLRPTAS